MHTKTKTNTKPPQKMGSTLTIYQQQVNHRLRTDNSLSYPGGGGGGLNAFYWRQIFALDSVVVKTQNCLARMEASSQRNNQIRIKHYDKTKKMANDSQIVRANKKPQFELRLAQPQRKRSGINKRIKALRQGRH